MSTELSQVVRRNRNLSLQLKWIGIRQAARSVLDRFRFGSGLFERLTAATVLAGVFFLLLLVASLALRLPPNTVLILCGISLGSAVVTSSLFVFGPSDEDLLRMQAEARKELEVGRTRGEELKRRLSDEKAARPQSRETAPARRPATSVHSEREVRRVSTCPYCKGEIQPRARKCPHCHEYLDQELAARREEALRPKPNLGVAAVLSFLIPGLGQIYKGQVLAGLLWWFTLWVIYFISILCVLSLVLICFGFVGIPVAIMAHLICIFDAASE